MIVEHDGHIRLGRRRQFAGGEVGVGGGQEDDLRPLRNRVLDLGLLLGRVALGVRDDDFDVRGLLLHGRNEKRRVAALEADRGFVRQEKENLRLVRGGGTADQGRRNDG